MTASISSTASQARITSAGSSALSYYETRSQNPASSKRVPISLRRKSISQQPLDVIDQIREQLAILYPDLDTSGVEVTGRILRLAAAIDSRRAEHLAQFGLTAADFDVLATIRRTQQDVGTNPRGILQSVMISSGGMTKRLDRLERAGFVERHPDPTDRRGVLIRLTTDGRNLIDRALVSLVSAEHQLVVEHLTTSQQQRMISGLRRLTPLKPSGEGSP